MSGTTPKWAIPYFLGSDIGNTMDNTDLARSNLLDGLLTPADAGVRSSRPVSTPGTPGKSGRTYRSTDDGGIDVDIGTGWVTLAPGLFAALPTQSGHAGDGLDDGMTINYLASAAKGIVWPLRYRSGSTDARKWEAIGTPMALTSVQGDAASFSTPNLTTWATLANTPFFTVPFSGHYRISFTGSVQASATGEIRVTAWRAGAPIGPAAGFVGLGTSAGGVVSADFDTEDFGVTLTATNVLTLVASTTGVSFTTGNPAPFVMTLTPRRLI